MAGISKYGSLDASQLSSLKRLNPDERRMYGAALAQLDALKSGTINAAEYQANLMDAAARLAGDDGKKFVELAALPMSAGTMGVIFDGVRAAAGAAPNYAGSAIELASQTARFGNGKKDPNTGFNPMVLDNEFPGDTITHHFGAYLQVAANRSTNLSEAVALLRDSPDTNPGDVRNGMFGAMLGGAAADRKLIPTDIARLNRWAMSADAKPPPPWGNDAKVANSPAFTSMSDFKLADWVRAYNTAHPTSPMRMLP